MQQNSVPDWYISFLARGQVERGESAVQAIIRGTYPTVGPGTVTCTVTLEADQWPENWHRQVSSTLRLRGKADSQNDILIPDFRMSSNTVATKRDADAWSGPVLEGFAPTFIQGDLSAPTSSAGRLFLSVNLPPTALARVFGFLMPNPDGTVTRDEDEEREGIEWQTSLGTATLIDNYVHYSVRGPFQNGALRLRQSQITIQGDVRDDVTIKSVLVGLDELLREPLLLLSFLSRKRLDWYKADASFMPADDNMDNFRMAEAWHQPTIEFGDQTALRFDSAVVPVRVERLREGLFQRLMTAYTSSPIQETLRQTIAYLIPTYERGYFESKLGNVYSALEGLVDRLGDVHHLNSLLGSSPFKRLKRKVVGLIHEVCTDTNRATTLSSQIGELIEREMGVLPEADQLLSRIAQLINAEVSDTALADGIIKKVPELQRRAFVDRLGKLLEEYRLLSLRKWDSGKPLTADLPDMVKRRDVFIHQGKVDWDHQVEDLYTLRGLVEVWVLTLLDCPIDALDPSAYYDALILP